MGELRTAGQPVLRKDLWEKVTGAAEYCVDVTVPGMLHARCARSTRGHARIVGIDTSAALAQPGVAAVVTGADLGALFPRFGHIVADHWILATGKVRYYGEPVALVVAETPAAAADAVDLVEVEYQELPEVLTSEQALADGAPLVHDQEYSATGDDSFNVLTGRAHDGNAAKGEELTNLAGEVTLEWGDVDAAAAQAHQVVESRLRYPMLYAYAMEPYNAVASYADGRLDVVSTAQHPYMVRDDLARVFDLPLSRVRVRSPYLGGGYGSKSYTKVEPLAAVGAWATRRPVKLVLDVEEAIYTTRADSAEVSVRSGFTADGTIVFREFDVTLDSGAYADNSPLVLAKCVNRCFGPYRVPNLRVRGRSVYTNTAPASSYRGFGAPQGASAGETNLDRAADQLGLDPKTIRDRNLIAKGEALLPGKRGMDADLALDLDMVVSSLEKDRRDAEGYGAGFACTASDAGAFPVSTAHVKVQTDGSVTVLSGSTEMGQGSRSLLAQIAAEELGLPLDRVQVVQSDTAHTPYERTTGASRTSTLTGLAVQRACSDARNRLLAMAAEVSGVSVDEVRDAPGACELPDGTSLDYGMVVRSWFGAAAGEVTGVGLVRRDGSTKQMPPFWEIGMVGVAVQVDTETGYVSLDKLVTVGDVGFAINPRAVEGQDLGAATQGLGGALYEELVYDGPQAINANVVDYRVPRVGDMPRLVDLQLAERADGVGPYGAKGSGEGAVNPTGAAVAAAVARAVGRWPARLPLTAERVWRLVNDIADDE